MLDCACAFDLPSLHVVHCISLSWHSPCWFGDAFPIDWDDYGFWCCHLNCLQPFPELSQCALSVLSLISANESVEQNHTQGKNLAGNSLQVWQQSPWLYFERDCSISYHQLCYDCVEIIFHTFAVRPLSKKLSERLLKSSDILYLLNSFYSLGSYLVKERNQINLPWTPLDKSTLAAGQWKKISLNHSWPKYSYWNTTGFDSALAGMHSRYPGERCQFGCSPVLPPKWKGKE